MTELPFEPEAIIFDLDGTLLDTEPLYTEAAQAVLDPYGHVFSPDLKRRIMGGDAMQGARLTVEEYDLPIAPEEFLTQRQTHLDRLFPAAPEIPGADNYLRLLAAGGMTVGLATSSHSRYFEMKTEQRAWRPLFQQIVCGDDPELSRSKPEPDIFQLCARRLGVNTRAVIAFEDSRNGILAAKAAGMTVIAVNSPYVGPHDLIDADMIIENYLELS